MLSTSGLAFPFPSPFPTATTLHPDSSSSKALTRFSALITLRHLCLITTRLPSIQSHASDYSQASELPHVSWDTVDFKNPMTTDFMFTMKCSKDGNFSDGGLQRFGKIEMNAAACVLNYGQGVSEELKAYKKLDNSLVLFHPEENGLRMIMGAERMCMPAPTLEQFLEAVKLVVLENRHWVPPPNKGFLYIRPLLMGNGPVLSVQPAPEFTFLIYAISMGNNLKGEVEPINLVVENEIHHAFHGGAGNVNAIGNYATVLKAQVEAKADGFSDVLYLDSVHKRYVEQISTANIFLVEERPVSVKELLEADEVFCTGNAVCLSPVGSITYLGKRVSYQEGGHGGVTQQLYHSTRLFRIYRWVLQKTIGVGL